MARAQHLAIRVSDIERSTRFYVEALNGVVAVNPYVTESAFAEMAFGIRNTEYLITLIQLSDEFGLELFQFVPQSSDTIGRPQPESGFMHFALGGR